MIGLVRFLRSKVSFPIFAFTTFGLFFLLAWRPLAGDPLNFGDASSRYLATLSFMVHPAYALRLEAWLSFWPAVPFICASFGLDVFQFVGPFLHCPLVTQYQLVSCVVTALGISLFSFVGAGKNDPLGVLTRAAFLLPGASLVDLSDQGMSEIFVVFFLAIASFAVCAPSARRRPYPFCGVAGFSLLCACFCRNEVVALVPAFALSAWLAMDLKAAFSVSVLPLSGVASKYLAALLEINRVHPFFRANDIYSAGEATHLNAVVFLRILGGASKPFLLVIVLCLLMFIFQKRLSKKAAQGSAGRAPRATRLSALLGKMRKYPDYVLWVTAFFCATSAYIFAILRAGETEQARFTIVPLVFLGVIAANLLLKAIKETGEDPGQLNSAKWRAGAYAVLVISLGLCCTKAAGLIRSLHTLDSGVRSTIDTVSAVRRPGEAVLFDFAGWREEEIAAYVASPQDFLAASYSDIREDSFIGPFVFSESMSAAQTRERIDALLADKRPFVLVEYKGSHLLRIDKQDLRRSTCFSCIESAMGQYGNDLSTQVLRDALRPGRHSDGDFVVILVPPQQGPAA
jgi:hypothetical protein